MFSKLFFIAAVISVAFAHPTTRSASQCNTGAITCCNSVQTASNPTVANQLGLLGIAAQAADVLVGLQCAPATIVGLASGSSCGAQPLCCEDNNFHGLVVVGCSPINL